MDRRAQCHSLRPFAYFVHRSEHSGLVSRQDRAIEIVPQLRPLPNGWQILRLHLIVSLLVAFPIDEKPPPAGDSSYPSGQRQLPTESEHQSSDRKVDPKYPVTQDLEHWTPWIYLACRMTTELPLCDGRAWGTSRSSKIEPNSSARSIEESKHASLPVPPIVHPSCFHLLQSYYFLILYVRLLVATKLQCMLAVWESKRKKSESSRATCSEIFLRAEQAPHLPETNPFRFGTIGAKLHNIFAKLCPSVMVSPIQPRGV